MRRLSMKAKKAKAERSDSESVAGSSSAAGSVSPPQDTSDEDSVSRKRNKRPKKAEPPKPKEDDDDRVDVGGDASKRRKRSSLPAKVEDQNENETDEYEVESVIDSKIIRGRTQYKIRWKGFGPENDTWEPEEDLNCADLIQKFLSGQSEASKGKTTTAKKRGSKSIAEAKTKKKKVNEKEEKNDGNVQQEEEEDASTEDGDKVYEVEKVIEVHFKKNGKREFLIRWKGFTQNDDTWEPEENLNCPELIEKFMAKVDKAKSATSRELRVNPQHTDRFTLNSPQRRRRLSRRIESKQRTSYHTYV